MSDIAIRVSNLGKQFTLGSSVGYKTLRETLVDLVRPPRNAAAETEARSFWALKNVNFEINRGEVVGVIGRNGAGKSTLLKILSRIVEPTEGRIELHGRIGSLLEVGTGFHPELTGRENIYMNGAILGMRRSEISSKFDEIVAFSEVEKFLDTPVKRYSSGMYMKLAFAVAANLDPEILVVDEVLAVGDAAFQKKCLGKMNEVAKGGRTVLFVSHNMAAIQQLTTRCLMLQKGQVQYLGPTPQAVELYLNEGGEQTGKVIDVENSSRRFSHLSREIAFTSFKLDHAVGAIASGRPLRLVLGVLAKQSFPDIRFSGTIARIDGSPVGSFFAEFQNPISAGQRNTYVVEILDHRLAPGRYEISIAVGRGTHRTGISDYDILMDIAAFEVAPVAGEDDTLSYWMSNWGSIYFNNVQVSELTSAAEER